MLKIIILALLAGLLESAIAQPIPDTLWTRGVGGANLDQGNSMDAIFGGGTVQAGQTRSFGAGNWDFYVTNYNSAGSLQWTRTYGGTRQDIAYDIQQTLDSGFIISGYSETRFVNGDAWLVKTNSIGDTAWTRYYGASAGFERYYGVQPLVDGYICCGTINSGGSSQIVLARYNLIGDSLWTKRIGGAGSEVGYDLQVDGDGGFIITGYTSSIGLGAEGCFLLKTNSNGDSLWSRVYGGTLSDISYALQIAADGGYYLAGRSFSFGVASGDLYLIRTTSGGDTLWTRTFGYSSAQLNAVIPASDGSCYVAGYGSSGVGQDYILMRISSAGSVLWTRTYGGAAQDLCTDLELTTAGEFYLSGNSQSYSPTVDYYLVKTGAEGSIGLLTPNGGENLHLLIPFNVTWFSSPASPSVMIELNRDYPAGSWESLSASTADDGSESVYVSGLPSTQCRVRVTQIPGGGSDVSDQDFSILLSSGQIALINLPDQTTEIHSWDSDSLECGTIHELTTRVKNFGTDTCIVWAPQPFSTAHFQNITTCTDSVFLAPGAYMSCFMSLRYDPVSDGFHYDTLRIRSNASNTVDGIYTFPVSGFRYSFPHQPDSLVAVAYADSIRLSWPWTTVSTQECLLDPPVTNYVVYTTRHRHLPFSVLDTVSTNTFLITAPLDTARFYRVTAIDPTP